MTWVDIASEHSLVGVRYVRNDNERLVASEMVTSYKAGNFANMIPQS